MAVECEFCETSFSYNIDLNRHIASVHEGKKKLKRELYEKRFSHVGDMNEEHCISS
jgi:hypothetical protein